MVPRELRQEVLRECHGIPAAGHQGIDRTKARLKDRFYWYGMLRDAQKYVSHMRSLQQEQASALSVMPEPKSLSTMRGFHGEGSPGFSGTLAPCSNEYVLVMVDQFTK